MQKDIVEKLEELKRVARAPKILDKFKPVLDQLKPQLAEGEYLEIRVGWEKFQYQKGIQRLFNTLDNLIAKYRADISPSKINKTLL